MKYTHVIFDKDGVLVDTERLNAMGKHRVLQEEGIEVDFHFHDRFIGSTFEEAWTAMREELGLKLEFPEFIEKWREKRTRLLEETPLVAMPGSLALLKRLKAKGIPLAVASSARLIDLENDLRTIGAYEYFDTIVSGQQCRAGKPEPDVYFLAAQMMGVSPENCLTIEDSTNGVRAAKAAGVYCVAYAPKDCPVQDISLADTVIDHFDRITDEWIEEKLVTEKECKRV